ncbi:MAG TPA: hypothetical protein VGG25_06510 [Streptosporangiaceae bacterium]
MIIRRLAALAAASATALLMLTGTSSAATAKVHHAGSCHARGEYATCVASGTAYDPTTIHVHVKSSHRGQHVYVAWSVVCTKGTGAGTRSGHYHATTISNRKISHPYRRPDNCTVAASAQLNGGSYIRIWITYWK